MKFSEEQLARIEELAGLFMSVTDIAVLIGVEPFQLKAEIRDYESPARTAYLRGKTISKAELLQNEMKFAKIGSPLGMEAVRKSLDCM